MQNMIEDIEINELKLKRAGNLLRILLYSLQILYTYYMYFIFYVVSVFFEKV